jgi:hypothetical protein
MKAGKLHTREGGDVVVWGGGALERRFPRGYQEVQQMTCLLPTGRSDDQPGAKSGPWTSRSTE